MLTDEQIQSGVDFIKNFLPTNGKIFKTYQQFHRSMDKVFKEQKNDTPEQRRESYIKIMEEAHKSMGIEKDESFTEEFCTECEKMFELHHKNK